MNKRPSSVSANQTAIITATVTTAMKPVKFRGKTTHACTCVVDNIEGVASLNSGDELGLTLCHHNWMKCGGYPRLKPGQAIKLKVIAGVDPCLSMSSKGRTQHEARLIIIPVGLRYAHDRAAELLEVMK
ncbi:hypothetical protein JFB16_001118 [Salmonella enterica subsp. enterica]|nr:hypothetical protein [Salmonella enterica subsp. enterica]